MLDWAPHGHGLINLCDLRESQSTWLRRKRLLIGRYRGGVRQRKQVSVASDSNGTGQRLDILGFRVPREEYPSILLDTMYVGVDVFASFRFRIDRREMRLWEDF